MPINAVLLLLGLLGGDGLVDHAKRTYGEDLTNLGTQEVLDLIEKVNQKEKRQEDAICLKSRKKGFSIGANDYLCDDFKLLENVNWYTDSQLHLKFLDKEKCQDIPAEQYVPMTRKGSDPWLGYAFYANADERFFFSYNRPMRTDSANLAPDAAAARWKEQREELMPGTVMVTPSGADCKNGKKGCLMGDIDWFKKFFAACDDCQFDYMAVTFFGCEPQWMINYLRKMWDEFHMPLWVTEFACISKNTNKVKDFMRAVIPELEATWYVYRYAWSRTRAPGKGNSLLKDGSSALTPVGELYNQY